jgi:hypothetical protein
MHLSGDLVTAACRRQLSQQIRTDHLLGLVLGERPGIGVSNDAHVQHLPPAGERRAAREPCFSDRLE